MDGVDLIDRLDKYVSFSVLKPATHFCILNITDVYIMSPQEGRITISKSFLLEYGHSQLRGVQIEAIEKLVRIFLTVNIFVYNYKYCH